MTQATGGSSTALSELKWRVATSVDFPFIVQLFNQAHTEVTLHVRDLERWERERLPGEPLWRMLVWHGGQLVGLAEVSLPLMERYPGWQRVQVVALPDWSAGPLPARLLGLAEAQAQRLGARVMTVRLHEHWWETPLYQARGYQVHDRVVNSLLDLRKLELEQLQTLVSAVEAQGIRLQSLAQLGPFEESLQRQVYELVHTLIPEVPSSHPMPLPDFPTWQHRILARLTQPEGFWLASAPDGQFIGVTELHSPVGTDGLTLHTGLTGILPAWRGRGLAIGLKAAASLAAWQRGYRRVQTKNHSRNQRILAINQQMGFVPESVVVALRKDVRAEALDDQL